ncbi:MAG: hypothetical protein RBT78_03025 [Kiritimatiellia bacterium]|jgi:hypothetical protein|nr:hypothetical protein [Kiritimatiellia bacterium]
MAEQDQAPQGAIPPKVTPFTKPNPETPAVTPAGAPRPITVRLKPVAPAAAPQAAVPAVGIPTAPPANPRATSRVPVTEAVLPGAAAPQNAEEAPTLGTAATVRPLASASATVRLRPVTPSPLQPQPPPTPGAHPLPNGPKPPSSAQVQAAKSKTSRISLDSAIGVAPMTPMGADKAEPKTIRLKRPADLVPPAASGPKRSTTPIRQTSRIPDSALPNAADGKAEPVSPTQKKTLKIKRPGAKPESGETAASGEAFPEGVQLTPINPLDFPPAKPESTVFTTIAVVAGFAAALVLLLLTCCLGAHAMGPNAGKNALASISGPELPWGGKLGK